jgi:hypothetical protein
MTCTSRFARFGYYRRRSVNVLVRLIARWPVGVKVVVTLSLTRLRVFLISRRPFFVSLILIRFEPAEVNVLRALPTSTVRAADGVALGAVIATARTPPPGTVATKLTVPVRPSVAVPSLLSGAMRYVRYGKVATGQVVPSALGSAPRFAR